MNIFQVTHLVISKPTHFKYSAGDYVFLQVPDLAAFEWHPFSISSAPEEGNVFWCMPSFDSFQYIIKYVLKIKIHDQEKIMNVSFIKNTCLCCCEFTKTHIILVDKLWLHIRSLGNWTNRLYDFYKFSEYDKCNQLSRFKTLDNVDLESDKRPQKKTLRREMMRLRNGKNRIEDHRKVSPKIMPNTV